MCEEEILIISYLRDLLRLNLVRNQLTEVPSDALLILKNLNQLDLSDNKISKLHQGIFEGKIWTLCEL